MKGSREDETRSCTGRRALDKYERQPRRKRGRSPLCTAPRTRLLLGAENERLVGGEPGPGVECGKGEGGRTDGGTGEGRRRGGGKRWTLKEPEVEPPGRWEHGDSARCTHTPAGCRAQSAGRASAPGRPPHAQPRRPGRRAGEDPASRSGRGPPHTPGGAPIRALRRGGRREPRARATRWCPPQPGRAALGGRGAMATWRRDGRLTGGQRLLCAAAAGALSLSLTAPLELATVLAQVGGARGQARGPWAAGLRVWRAEGPRALWKGNAVACLRLFPCSAVQLAAYRK